MNPRPVPSRRPAAVGVALLALALVACAPASGASGSPSISATPSGALPSETAGTSPSTEPSDALGAFTCDMPIEGGGTVDRAQITDVRVGTHDDYDRVVIEFDEGIPSFTLDEAMPPLTADPSGMEMDVEGSAFWSLVLRAEHGSPRRDDVVRRTDRLHARLPALAQLVEAGDFEAVSSWYIGLHVLTCARVLTLTAPVAAGDRYPALTGVPLASVLPDPHHGVRMADRPMPPTGALDLTKSYSARLQDGARRDRLRAVRRRRAADRGELRQPGARRLLRRHDLPPRDPRLHGPGRRPDRHRLRRPGLPVPRRVLARRRHDGAGRPVDGQRRPGHERQPVLPHLRADAASRRSPHRLRPGDVGAWTCCAAIRERDPQRDPKPGDRIETIEIEES